MRKMFLLLSVVAVFGLVGCGKSDAEKAAEQQKEAATVHFKATPMPDPKDYKQPKKL